MVVMNSKTGYNIIIIFVNIEITYWILTDYSKGGENGIAPVKIAHFPNKH